MWNKEKVKSFVSGFLSVFGFGIAGDNMRQNTYKESSWYFFKAQNYVRLAKAVIRDEGEIKDERDKEVF